MTIDTSLRITDASGNFLFETREFLEIGNSPGLHYVLACGKVGALTVTLPPDFNNLLLKDGRIHVMRSVNGNPAQREGNSCYLIRRWDYADDYTIVTALHANHLFWRRFFLFSSSSGSGYTDFDGASALPADDLIKTIWKDNAGALAPATRAPTTAPIGGNDTLQTDISAFVSTQANAGAGPTFDISDLTWQSVGDTILAICDQSYSNGTYLAAEVVVPSESTLEVQTFTGQRGVDRRFSGGNGLLFSSQRGNFANGIMTVDAQHEATMVQALGSGVGLFRVTATAHDATRMGETPFGRIEAIVDDAQNDVVANLQVEAGGSVRMMRPVIQAKGELVDTDTCTRGIHYNYGDLVTVELRGIQYDMRIDTLDITLSQGVERTRTGFFYNG